MMKIRFEFVNKAFDKKHAKLLMLLGNRKNFARYEDVETLLEKKEKIKNKKILKKY